MNCKDVRDMLGEYLDGEMSPGLGSDVERHIASFRACRDLAESTKRFAIEPLAKAQKVKAPEGLWGQIRARIEKEENKALAPANILERLWADIAARRPVFALAAATVVIIAVVTLVSLPLKGQNDASAYMRDQAEFYSYLDGENGSNGDFDTASLGTSLEDFFL